MNGIFNKFEVWYYEVGNGSVQNKNKQTERKAIVQNQEVAWPLLWNVAMGAEEITHFSTAQLILKL